MSYRITAAPAAVNNEAAAPAAANGANTKITKTYDPLKTFHNELFSPDYIKNNPLLIFITSPDNKFEPLTVYTIIRGSIKLKQTLCSENFFLWGGANSSQLQFECCSSDLIDNAPDGKIQLQLVPTIYEEGKLKQRLDEKKSPFSPDTWRAPSRPKRRETGKSPRMIDFTECGMYRFRLGSNL